MGVVHAHQVDTRDNVADLFTKALPVMPFWRHSSRILGDGKVAHRNADLRDECRSMELHGGSIKELKRSLSGHDPTGGQHAHAHACTGHEPEGGGDATHPRAEGGGDAKHPRPLCGELTNEPVKELAEELKALYDRADDKYVEERAHVHDATLRGNRTHKDERKLAEMKGKHLKYMIVLHRLRLLERWSTDLGDQDIAGLIRMLDSSSVFSV